MTRTAVITMVQRRDFPEADRSLATVATQLGPDRLQLVLLNDERDAELEARLEAHPHRRVIAPGRNLGVPVGRNTLIDAALDWDADLVVTLDDDLIVPSDYLDRIEDYFAAADDSIGLVAPALLDHGAVVEALGHQPAPDLGTEELRELLREVGRTPSPRVVQHLGIGEWRTHYLRPHGRLAVAVAEELGATPERFAERRRNAADRALVLADPPQDLPVDTVPGGVAAFRPALLRNVGPVDERFSPFGYEDAELAIRARAAGFDNRCLPWLPVLHDIARRGSGRDALFVSMTSGRGRALIVRGAGLDDPADLFHLLVGIAVDRAASAMEDGEAQAAAAIVLAYVVGVTQGLLRGTEPTSWRARHRASGGRFRFDHARLGTMDEPAPRVRIRLEGSCRRPWHSVLRLRRPWLRWSIDASLSRTGPGAGWAVVAEVGAHRVRAECEVAGSDLEGGMGPDELRRTSVSVAVDDVEALQAMLDALREVLPRSILRSAVLDAMAGALDAWSGALRWSGPVDGVGD